MNDNTVIKAALIGLGIIWAIVLFPMAAGADTIVKYGAGIPKDNEKFGNTKAIFLAYQDKWFGPFIYQYEGGYWADNVGNGRRSSAMVSPSFGINTNSGGAFAQALLGPALISKTDTILGGNFQFNNDIAIGLKDQDSGNTFGIAYKHLSSAGLELPNKGRDFLMFRVGIAW